MPRAPQSPPTTQDQLLASRLENLLHRRDLSPLQVARLADLPLSVIQRLLNSQSRQPSLWTLVRLADVLTVSVDYLAGRTDDEHPPRRQRPPRRRPAEDEDAPAA
jgi:transcriptional regulator with XRE-family HTH domain